MASAEASSCNPTRVVALLTCHNRRQKTISCLRALREQKLPPDFALDLVLVDDGSTDGTSDAVRSIWPNVTLIRADGSHFWCGGMRIAWQNAARQKPGYYLLLNDDTLLEPQAIAALLEITSSPDVQKIAVGAITGPSTGRQTYGGRVRRYKLAPADGSLRACETFNANCALIPSAVYNRLGGFHSAYTHAMGDYDYGFEATRHGIPIIQTPHPVGFCDDNPVQGTWRDRSLSVGKRLKLLQSPKGLPWKEWLTYTRRNEGLLWPWRFVSPIVRILLFR